MLTAPVLTGRSGQYCLIFRRRQRSPFPWGQACHAPRADAPAHQSQGRVAYRSGHAPHLTVAPLTNHQFDPTGRDAGAVADRWVARPQLRFGHQACLGRGGYAVIELHPLAQGLQGGLGWLAFHLYPVGLGQLVARMADKVLQVAIIREQHQSFAVAIQSPGRIDTVQRHAVGEGGAAGRVGELWQHTVGLVDEDDGAHGYGIGSMKRA